MRRTSALIAVAIAIISWCVPASEAGKCLPAPNLDNVQATLGGTYGGTGYGGDGRSRFVVVVADYATHKPLAGVPVDVTHNMGTCTRNGGCKPMHPHPPGMERMHGKTGRDGRVIFNVPDLEYQLWLPPQTLAGYLDYSSTYNMGARACHDLQIQASRVDRGTKYFVVYLVPTSLLAVKRQDQAIALAQAVPEIQSWLADHAQYPYRLSVTGGPPSSPTMWQVRWGTDKVLKRLVYVNAFDGTASVGGRWTD